MLQLNSFQYYQMFQLAPLIYHSTAVQAVVQLPSSSQLMFAAYWHEYVMAAAAFGISASCDDISLWAYPWLGWSLLCPHFLDRCIRAWRGNLQMQLVMPMARLGSCRPLGWAVFGPARAGKSALAQSQLKLARANRISPKKSARNGLLKTSKNT